jgi:PEP-CTERM motif
MRLNLLTASLIATLSLTACADHASRIVAGDNNTQPPIGPSDGNTVGGGSGGTGGTSNPGGTTNTGGGTGNTSGGTSGSASSEPIGNGDPSTVQDGSVSDGLGGGSGGSPVPEPGTMLLVGTGLAGAALMRRRKQGLSKDATPAA